ncbi:MAG: ABC transporter ATP-binding protein [Clostridiales bacterium]|nr:ABC transporter ATP-binding protein [Clostridiales bacterium]
MEKYLEFKNVNFNYFTKDAEFQAINNLSFIIKKGEFVSVVGPSGCGKTTILSLIAGLYEPTEGQILLEGESVKKANIGYMFQRDHLFPWRTIYKNILLSLEIKGKKHTDEQKNYIDNLLNKYGIFDFKDKHPNELSGGMRQRVALIRTLAVKPKLLLLDEPFSALDFQTRLDVCDDVKNIIKQEGQTAILVTHDISEAISMSDKVFILSKRPATLKNVVNLEFNQELSPLERRDDKNFSGYFKQIWEELTYEKA